MVNNLWQLLVTGPLVEMNEVRGDVDGSILVQRQCDELGLEFDVNSHDIYCAGLGEGASGSTATNMLRLVLTCRDRVGPMQGNVMRPSRLL